MIPTQWPAMTRPFDPFAFDTAAVDDPPYIGGFARPQPTDGVGRPWWCGANAAGPPSAGFGSTTTTNGILAVLGPLLNGLLGLLGTLLSQALGTPGASSAAASSAPRAGATLFDSSGIAGGYRVVASSGDPADGLDAATVFANGGRDAVTLAKDGSIAVTSGGSATALAKGQTLTLAGGETVTENDDGSIVVAGADGHGRSVATTLSATGAGVDVVTEARQSVGAEPTRANHAHRGHHPGARRHAAYPQDPLRDVQP